MAKLIAICGKICCGKSYYANILKQKENAVVLSCDEITSAIFDNNLGDNHDIITGRIKDYLLKKSVEILQTNTNVIFDWGFWNSEERKRIKDYFKALSLDCEFHFLDIDDESWQINIKERNERVLSGSSKDYYLDEGLLAKLLSLWQQPTKQEIDVWICWKR